MLGLLILVRDSLLVLLMSWAGLDVTPEKQDDTNKSQSSVSVQRIF